jgi:hypothetical protein
MNKRSKFDSTSSFGFIALLDALGVSSYSLESSKIFIRNRDILIEQLQTISAKLGELERDLISPEIFTFGDTLLFTWNVGKERIMKGLVPVGEWISTAILLGIRYKMLFRGSISVGEYITEKNTVVGPAVADAAAWYEDADWFGVTLTPSLEFHLISLIESEYGKEKVDFEKWFVEYPIPRKMGNKRQWCVSWPYKIWESQKPPSPKSTLSTMLWDFPKPKGTETKYQNSFQFFLWYGKTVYSRMKEKTP